jgi:hypothetical protein
MNFRGRLRHETEGYPNDQRAQSDSGATASDFWVFLSRPLSVLA